MEKKKEEEEERKRKKMNKIEIFMFGFLDFAKGLQSFYSRFSNKIAK